MLPGTPWDIGASAPIAVKDLAMQGQTNMANVAEGKLVTPQLDLVKPITDTIKKAVPELTTVPWISKGIQEVKDMVLGENDPQAPAAPSVDVFGRPIMSDGSEPVEGGPTLAADLGPTLEEQMQALRDVFGR